MKNKVKWWRPNSRISDGMTPYKLGRLIAKRIFLSFKSASGKTIYGAVDFSIINKPMR